MIRLRGFSAAALSRFAVTTASKASPSWSTARQRQSLPLTFTKASSKCHRHWIAAHVRDPPLADLGGDHRAKPVPPEPHGLMADVDPALRQEILDIAQRQRVSHIHHHHQTNDFWRAVEIPERVAHGSKLPQPGKAQEIGLTEPA